jgi:hypothetical protein
VRSAVVAASCSVLLACAGVPPERQALTAFFSASRVRDTTVLARLAAVTFEPRRDGVVQRFEIRDFGDERQSEDGRTVSKEVTVEAVVRGRDGAIVQRALAIRMRRPADEQRWFITAFRPLPDSRTSPAASSGLPN